ncbi:MAG: gliding motility protein GldM, partial [Bacteroidota bacterium]
MSIPKEPRQIMINLMYIVLTAILALNVSAEILNAFVVMDKGIAESNSMVDRANHQIIAAIDQQADAYRQFEPQRKQAHRAQEIAQEFVNYVEEIKQEIIKKSGGYDKEGRLKGLKNKDVTSRIMLKEGRGDELEVRIKSVRDSLLALVEQMDDRALIEGSIPLRVQELPEDTDKETWAELFFQQMPIVAVLPLLSKLQNDAKVAETTLLNYFFDQISGEDTHNAYVAMVAANKSYVIRGEELNAEIFLGAYSSTTNNIAVRVNGQSVPVRDGKALFQTRPNTIGPQTLDVQIKKRHPITQEINTYNKTYKYEVGERSVAVSADKMNVFYAGVDNPISISVAGVPSQQVRVSAEGLSLQSLGNGQYTVKPRRPGQTAITVSGGGLTPTSFPYRIKRIPDPKILIGNKNGGTMSPGELKAYRGLHPHLERFDFDAVCE